VTLRDPNTWLGTAEITPKGPAVAGSFATWTIAIRVGRYGIDDTGAIQVLIRSACDWGRPQIGDPSGEGYTTVSTTGRARLVLRADSQVGVRPWAPGIGIRVVDGSLAEGDVVTVVLGDTSGGGPGMRVQTYPDDGFEIRVMIDNIATGQFERLPTSPVVPVITGPASRFELLAPSDAVVGEPSWLVVKALDAWGNADWGYRGTVRLSGPEGLPAEFAFSAADRGVKRFDDVRWHTPGTATARAASDELAGESNPIVVHAASPSHRLWWGDTQGQSGATVGAGGVEQFFRYARDVAALDFIVHSGNDFQITNEHWEETRHFNKAFHQPGRFVTFLSFEWSGNTPAGGDHNILYLNDDGPLRRSSHWLIADKSDESTDRYPISELWEEFRGRTDMMAVAHVGGRRADFDFHDPEFCHVIEICSVHGRFEWFAREALQRGCVLGFVGATDDHSGRPGASYPTARGELPVRGGLAGVYATELTRESIWEALRARRTYATTGERMVLGVRAGDRWMGERFSATAPLTLDIHAIGSRALESLDVFNGQERVHSHDFGPPGRGIRITWTGARVDSRTRHLRWDGGLELSAGRILAAEPYGFDAPSDGILERGERTLRWRSGTSNDDDGVTIELDTPADAEVHFKAGPADLRFKPADIGAEPRVWDLGYLEQRVSVSRLPDAVGPRELRLQVPIRSLNAGLNPIWVRAIQADSETAWSSPLYVDMLA
jgi:hypothetical protein